MKYTRDQDIDAVISSLRTGKPKKQNLIKRLHKKYGASAAVLILESYSVIDGRNYGKKS